MQQRTRWWMGMAVLVVTAATLPAADPAKLSFTAWLPGAASVR